MHTIKLLSRIQKCILQGCAAMFSQRCSFFESLVSSANMFHSHKYSHEYSKQIFTQILTQGNAPLEAGSFLSLHYWGFAILPCYGMGKRDYNETIIFAGVFKKTISWWDPMRYAGIYGTSWLKRKKKLVSVIKLDITLERK